MFLKVFRTTARRLAEICLIAVIGTFVSLAPSGAVERYEQKPQAASSAAHSKKSLRSKRSAHRRPVVVRMPRQHWRTGFDDSPNGGWYDDQSPEFGVSLGSGCWDLPQYARLYGCDHNDFNW